MRGMSIKQPWASALASPKPGAKRVENRGLRLGYRGLLAIHASLTPDRSAGKDGRVRRLLGDDAWEVCPVGAILAVAHLEAKGPSTVHEMPVTSRVM